MSSHDLIVPFNIKDRMESQNILPLPKNSSSIQLIRTALATPTPGGRKCLSTFDAIDMKTLVIQLRSFEKRVRGSMEPKHIINWLRWGRREENPVIPLQEDFLQVRKILHS